VKLARERDDSSINTLSHYRELLDDSIIMKDLHMIRNVTDFAHSRPHLFTDYPELLSEVARAYLTVDGTPKAKKYMKLGKMLASAPKRRLLSDALGGVRSMF
jgi:electron transfer flavoprotein-quinone oxidoreductase